MVEWFDETCGQLFAELDRLGIANDTLVAYVADNGFEKTWPEAAKEISSLTDLLNGIPTIFDAELRGKAYEQVTPLLAETLPAPFNNG